VALVFLEQWRLGTGDTGYGLLISLSGVDLTLASFLLLRWNRRLWLAAPWYPARRHRNADRVCSFPAARFADLVSGRREHRAGKGGKLHPSPAERSTFSAGTNLRDLAYAAGGPLLTVLSPRIVFVLAGGTYIVVSLLVRVMLSRSTPVTEREALCWTPLYRSFVDAGWCPGGTRSNQLAVPWMDTGKQPPFSASTGWRQDSQRVCLL